MQICHTDPRRHYPPTPNVDDDIARFLPSGRSALRSDLTEHASAIVPSICRYTPFRFGARPCKVILPPCEIWSDARHPPIFVHHFDKMVQIGSVHLELPHQFSIAWLMGTTCPPKADEQENEDRKNET